MLIIPDHKGNVNQNHTKILPPVITPVIIARIKNTTNKKCWQGCGGKKEHSYTAGGNVS
jgi:hypothetical protein